MSARRRSPGAPIGRPAKCARRTLASACATTAPAATIPSASAASSGRYHSPPAPSANRSAVTKYHSGICTIAANRLGAGAYSDWNGASPHEPWYTRDGRSRRARRMPRP